MKSEGFIQPVILAVVASVAFSAWFTMRDRTAVIERTKNELDSMNAAIRKEWLDEFANLNPGIKLPDMESMREKARAKKAAPNQNKK